MSDQPAILAEGLRKAFGEVPALGGVDLAARAGSVLGLLGPNGAGKSTAVRILTTLLRPDAGHARVAGLDVARQPAAVRQVMGLAGQAAAVDEYLTGRENLLMAGRLHHLDRAEAHRRAAELLQRFELAEAADRTVRTFSGGMRRRLDLAVSLVGHPRVLFLDEPSSGLDPRGRQQLWQTIRQLVEDGATVLLTTQYLEEADQLADHVVVIDHGRVIANGTPEQLKRQVGGERLHLRLATAGDAGRVAELVADLDGGTPRVDPRTGVVTVPIADGVASLAEVVRRLDAAGVVLADLALRRPTLDDVFLALTGRPAPASRSLA
jgi:daunorubicin resistance ABC transporter ATP-binding subunit